MVMSMVNADIRDMMRTDEANENGISKSVVESTIATQARYSKGSKLTKRRRDFDVTRWYGIGWLERTHSSYTTEPKECSTSEMVNINTQFLPASWLHLPGISIFQTRSHSYRKWSYTSTPIYVASSDSPIFAACEAVNIEEVEYLFASGQATIYGTNENGWTILHVKYTTCLRR